MADPAAERARNARLLRLYGMTAADYDVLLSYQSGACAVCRKPPGKTRLHVDHDHVSARVRGLLCYQCNAQVVAKHRTPAVLRAAAEYLASPPADDVFVTPRLAPPRPRRKRRKAA